MAHPAGGTAEQVYFFFMGRRKLDDGRRITVSAKISEQHAASIDKERGTLSRSSWLARLVAAHFGPPAAPPGPPGPQ